MKLSSSIGLVDYLEINGITIPTVEDVDNSVMSIFRIQRAYNMSAMDVLTSHSGPRHAIHHTDTNYFVDIAMRHNCSGLAIDWMGLTSGNLPSWKRPDHDNTFNEHRSAKFKVM